MTESQMLREGIVRGINSFGATIDKVENGCVYITVPAESDQLDADGIPMCGNHLAKRVKRLIVAYCGDKYKVLYREKK